VTHLWDLNEKTCLQSTKGEKGMMLLKQVQCRHFWRDALGVVDI